MKVHLVKVCKKCPTEIKRIFKQSDADEEKCSDDRKQYDSDSDIECVSVTDTSETSTSLPKKPPVPPAPGSSNNDEMETAFTPTPSPSSSRASTREFSIRPSSSRSIYEFSDRITEKEQASIFLFI